MKKMHVTMFDNFTVSIDGKEIYFDKNQTTKSMQLFEILIYFGEEGVPRKWLLNSLYTRDNVSNPSNNLRVTAHRLRKILNDAGLPDQDYIKIENSKYIFQPPYEMTVDVHEFERLINDARSSKNEEKKILLYEAACEFYKGDFLPALVGEDWAVVESVRLQTLYFDCLREQAEYYKDLSRFDKVIDICDKAVHIYPHEEWYIEKIDALIAMDKYSEAIKVYEDAANRFFEEFGISPSDEMVERYRKINSKVKNSRATLDTIKKKLSEHTLENGALYCSYPSFVDNYRMIRRIVVRSGQSVYLMMCSIVETDGMPMENTKKLQVMAAKLKESIVKSLRLGDVVTRYSKNQFIVILLDTDKESCSIVSNRILKKFTEEHKSWRNYVEFNEVSIMDVENIDKKQLRFKTVTWK